MNLGDKSSRRSVWFVLIFYTYRAEYFFSQRKESLCKNELLEEMSRLNSSWNAAKADFPIISGANGRKLMLVLSITGSANFEKPVIPFLIPKVSLKER